MVIAPKKKASVLRLWANLKCGMPTHVCFVEQDDSYITFDADAEVTAKLLDLKTIPHIVGTKEGPTLVLDKQQMNKVDAAFKPTQVQYCVGGCYQ